MLCFHIRDCRVELHFSCFALLAFCCIFSGFSGGASVLAAVLLHELAHLAALGAFGSMPKTVRLSALGCNIGLNPQRPLDGWQSAAVSLAGPGCNLLCFFLALLMGRGEGPFAGASLALGLLHSLPAEPLDGGMALRALLGIFLPPDAARKCSLFCTAVTIVPLAALGFLLLFHTPGNFSLLLLSLYLILYLLFRRDLF